MVISFLEEYAKICKYLEQFDNLAKQFALLEKQMANLKLV
jgi:hypothetical protein